MEFFNDKAAIENINNLPEKYFIVEDNEVYLTPFFEYKLAKIAETFFKSELLKRDTNHEFTNVATKDNVKDEEATQANKDKYADRIEQFNKVYSDYIQNHLDEYETIEIIDPDVIKDGVGYVGVSFYPDTNFSLEECWEGYVAARLILDKYKEDKDNLPKKFSRRSKPEYKDIHAKYKEQLRNKLGIPEDKEFNVYKDNQEVTTLKRLTAKKKVVNDTTPITELAREFENYLINEY